MTLIGLGILMLTQPFLARSLHLLIRHDPGRRARVRRRQPLSAVRSSSWREIRVERLHKAFHDFVAVKDSSFVIEDRLLLRHVGPLGMRQDDDPADDRRP